MRAPRARCCSRAQHRRFYRHSRPRWHELARTAQSVVVFADFDRARKAAVLHEVPVPDDAPLQREWMLVCDADDYPACLAGWEIPGQRPAGDTDRRFEVLWTVDPRVVRDAAQICAQLTHQFAPTAARSLASRRNPPGGRCRPAPFRRAAQPDGALRRALR